MSMIWKRLDVQGGELTLALALGDFANDHGESIWPSVATLCFKTRQGERTVRRQLARFRELKWLEIMKAGGGAGQTTVYRINPEWIKGANLAGFPDLKGREFAEEKGADLAGLEKKPCHPQQETLPSATQNPATAVAPNPSGSINKPQSAAARAIPTGSRAAKTPEPEPFDEAATRAAWWNRVQNEIVGLAKGYGITKRENTRVDQLDLYLRTCMTELLAELTAFAVETLRAAWPHTAAKAAEIDVEITARVARDMRNHVPQLRDSAA